MTKNIFRICTILALSFAAWQTSLSAQDEHTIKGTWAVAVTVVNCQTGAPIRTVHSLQLFSRDGSFSETASTFLRGSSVGVWDQTADHTYKRCTGSSAITPMDRLLRPRRLSIRSA
jgi:hypothetical protein